MNEQEFYDLARAASDNVLEQYNMTAPYRDVGAGVLVATDGHRMHLYTGPLEGPEGYLHLPVKPLSKQRAAPAQMQAHSDPTLGVYPNWKGVLPKDEDLVHEAPLHGWTRSGSEVVFPPDLLAALSQSYVVVMLTASGWFGSLEGRLGPVPRGAVQLNGEYFADAVRFVGAHEHDKPVRDAGYSVAGLTLRVGDSLVPVTLTNAAGTKTAVIMPRRYEGRVAEASFDESAA
jgi:hypothetical protein